MRSLNLPILLVLATALLTVSCQKRGEYEVDCKIKKIVSKYRFSPSSELETNTHTFYYNAWGDPESIVRQFNPTGMPNLYFHYDNKRRLTSYEGIYPNGGHEFNTRYFYNSNGFIAFDTTYAVPTTFVRTYSYDLKGRVSKVATQVLVDPVMYFETNYNYDARGNLIMEGYTYDNKTHFLRTSLVLAFISRNYSMNNEATALSYNKKGLPVSFPIATGIYYPKFLSSAATEVQYTCDNNYGNH